MGWDVGYSGDCPKCGAQVHHLAADKPRMSAQWLRCPVCVRADPVLVEDGTETSFWSVPHPCPRCGGTRERWEASRCPSCGEGNVGRFTWMAD